MIYSFYEEFNNNIMIKSNNCEKHCNLTDRAVNQNIDSAELKN